MHPGLLLLLTAIEFDTVKLVPVINIRFLGGSGMLLEPKNVMHSVKLKTAKEWNTSLALFMHKKTKKIQSP